tara:strand:- start:258125 stop:258724 length:600 start_codon:yes stop_codon:yes gene_type:complete
VKRLFVSKISYFKIGLSTLLIFITLPFFLALFWVLALATFLYIRRSIWPNYKDGLAINPELIFSPINGKVKWVDNETREVCLSVSLCSGLGVYFPCKASVEELKIKNSNQSKWRGFTNRRNRYNLTLRDTKSDRIFFEIEPLLLSFRSFVEVGDRAKMSACMGYLPFGGKVKLRFPLDAKLLVSKGETLKAGETVLAGA